MDRIRNSRIELLRIVSILMVVLSHFSFHGFYTEERYNWIINPFDRWFLQVSNLGSLGVDLFVMISGYFLIRSYDCKPEKVYRLTFKVLSISLFLYFIAIVSGLYTFNFRELFTALTPNISGCYWFITSYICLYIFHPYINKAILPMGGANDKEKHASLIVIMFVIWCMFHTFLGCEFYGNEISQFVMLYLIGGYIRLYGIPWSNKSNKLLMMVLILIWCLLPILGILLSSKTPTFGEHVTFFYSRNSVLTILLATSIFVSWISNHSFNNIYINKCAAGVLGVYLISDNYYVQQYVYDNIFHVKIWAESYFLPIVLIVFTIITFVSCALLDRLLSFLFKYPMIFYVYIYSYMTNKLYVYIKKKL